MKIFKSIKIQIIIGFLSLSLFSGIFVSGVTIYRTKMDFREIMENKILGRLRGGHFPEKPRDHLREVIRAFENNLYLTVFLSNIVSIILAMCFGYFIAQRITVPVRRLKKSIGKLEKNEFLQLDSDSVDEEFREVIRAFNRLSENLARSEELRKNVISDISHELKTPISAIWGQIQSVEEGVLELDQKRLQTILREIKRLDSLVDELRQYTNMRGEIIKFKKQDIHFKKVIIDIGKTYENNLENVNINLDTTGISEDFILKGDEKFVRRIFLNLIDNAIKYSDGDYIKILVKDQKIILEDNGIGIKDSDLKNIFERFFRVEKSRNRKTGGLGLGLAIVKELILAHGWEIEVSSKSRKGTKFTIYIQ